MKFKSGWRIIMNVKLGTKVHKRILREARSQNLYFLPLVLLRMSGLRDRQRRHMAMLGLIGNLIGVLLMSVPESHDPYVEKVRDETFIQDHMVSVGHGYGVLNIASVVKTRWPGSDEDGIVHECNPRSGWERFFVKLGNNSMPRTLKVAFLGGSITGKDDCWRPQTMDMSRRLGRDQCGGRRNGL